MVIIQKPLQNHSLERKQEKHVPRYSESHWLRETRRYWRACEKHELAIPPGQGLQAMKTIKTGMLPQAPRTVNVLAEFPFPGRSVFCRRFPVE